MKQNVDIFHVFCEYDQLEKNKNCLFFFLFN